MNIRLFLSLMLVIFSFCLEAINAQTWNAFTLSSGLYYPVNTVTIFNGNLYAGGACFFLGENYNYIAEWNGTNWSNLDLALDNYVNKLFVFNNELYAGGGFTYAGVIPANHVVKLAGAIGIKENFINNMIHIYPDPSDGKFTIDCKGELIIYNLL
jgi:hypothetical protein